MRKVKIVLTVFIIIYVLLRLLLVSSRRDAIFDNTEFFSGTIAMELIHGASLPVKNLFPDDHNFGSVVNGILIVPFYLFFGPSAASAKMVSILFSLGVLVFWYLLLARFFNPTVAIFASLLCIFSPTIYTKCSVLSIGSHPETCLFTAAILFIAYLIFFDKRKKSLYFILLGLSSGFAFFYSYLCGVTLLVLFILWFAFDKKFIIRPKFYLFLASFLVGFSPRIYFATAINSKVGLTRFLGFFEGAFDEGYLSFSHIVSKLKVFLTNDLLRLFNFEHLPFCLGYLYYAIFFICLLHLLWINRYSICRLLIPLKFKQVSSVSRESIFLLFIFIYSGIYIFSRYAIWPGWQAAGYIVPLYPFIFAIVAIGCQRLMQTRYKPLKIILATGLGIILLAGVYENIALVAFKKIGQGFLYKGYSYRMFGERIGASNFAYPQVVEKIKNIDFSKRKYFMQGFGWGIANIYNSDKAMVARLEDFLKKSSFGQTDRLNCFKGFGRGIAHQMSLYLYHKAGIYAWNNKESNLLVLKNIIGNDEEDRRYFWWGFGQGSDFPHADKIMGEYVEEWFKPCFYEGLGELISRQNLEGTGLDFIHEFDPQYVGPTYKGYQRRHTESLVRDDEYDS
jgi:hypothetical protein